MDFLLLHARDSQNWHIRVKSSALVTGFVLAEGTEDEDNGQQVHERSRDSALSCNKAISHSICQLQQPSYLWRIQFGAKLLRYLEKVSREIYLCMLATSPGDLRRRWKFFTDVVLAHMRDRMAS